MADMRIELDEAQYARIERILQDVAGGARKAVSGAINDTLAVAKTDAARRIGEHINLKSSEIKKRLPITRATPSKLVGIISLNREEVPLGYFKGYRQTKAGVSISVRPGKREMIKSAFVATMKSGHTGIFKRASVNGGPSRRVVILKDGSGNRNNSELPIRELRGPTILGTVQRAPEIIKETLAEIGPKLADRVESKVAYLLQKQAAKS